MAFEALIKQYERLVFSIAYKMLNNREDASDLAQEALIKVYKTLDRCDDIVGFKNWLCRITTNACIDELRRRKNKQTLSINSNENDMYSILESRATADPTPEDVLLQRERTRDLANAINNLSET